MTRNVKTKNVFVMAPLDIHLEAMETLEGFNEEIRIHPLLEKKQLIEVDELPIRRLLNRARRELEEFPDEVSAILAHWDFPVTLMVPLLCRHMGLRSPSLEAVLQCSHKYWSRKAQQEAIPEVTPRFQLVDPFEPDAAAQITLKYPYWLKPVKAFASTLGFRIRDRGELEQALEKIRTSLGRLSDPFDRLLREVDVPRRFLQIGAGYCLAEEYLEGVEIAHAGFVQDGRMRLHGTLDMVREKESFTRLVWPSSAPEEVLNRMEETSWKFLSHIGYEDGCFNAEYFWDRNRKELRVIEFNPRISQSHTPLCLMVDGRTNHQVALDVALGREPRFEPRSGPCRKAVKFLIRTQKDGVTKRVPTGLELRELQDRFSPAVLRICVKEGERLSEMIDQDAYTYKLGEAYLGGASEEELLDTYWRLLEELPLEIEGVMLPHDILGARPPR